jgi:ATP-dependent Clp protease adapter protein ClpS
VQASSKTETNANFKYVMRDVFRRNRREAKNVMMKISSIGVMEIF